MVADPAVDFLVGGAGGDEVFELGGIQAGEFPEEGAEASGVEIVFAVDAEEVGAGFVEHAGGNDEAAEGFAGAAGWGFAQVAGEWF